MREYLVVLGFVSASSSSRKDRNSFSATSSRVRVVVDGGLVDGASGGCEMEVDDRLSSFDDDGADAEDHSQPILNVEIQPVVKESEAEDVVQM